MFPSYVYLDALHILIILDERIKKLDDKSKKCIFIDYSEMTKGYKLYNPLTKKVIVSRDVQFLEDEAWNQNKKDGQQQGAIIEDESKVEETNRPLPES